MEPNELDSDPRSNRKSNDLVWNLLTLLVVIATLCILAVFAIIFVNPASAVNPLPPLPLPPTVALPAATSTEKYFPPTWTPTITPIPTDTPTPPPPTATTTQFVLTVPVNSATQTAEAKITPTRIPTLQGNFTFAVPNPPTAVTSTIIHPDLGCKWFGVGGQSFDLNSAPVTGLTIELGGTLNGKTVSMMGLTGTVLNYGQSGYELPLGDTPIDSKQKLWVRLYDQGGLPLSDKIYFDTFKDCEKNLILINFKQVR